MKVVFAIDDSLTVAAYIEDVAKPSPSQALALRDLAIEVGKHRDALRGLLDE